MDESYDPKKLISKEIEYPKIPGEFYTEWDNPLRAKDSTIFNIGQSYSEEPDKTIFCAICGSDKFYVGQGAYHTSIKCPTCEYELTIHTG